MLGGNDLKVLANLLKESQDSDSDSDYESSRAKPKAVSDKGGEDPNFRAVIKGNMRKASDGAANTTPNSDVVSSTHSGFLRNTEPDLDEETKERLKLERREQRRRLAEVEALRRQRLEEEEQFKAQTKAAETESSHRAVIRYGEPRVPVSKLIWRDDEVPEDELEEDFVNQDTRTEPEYEILYKQTVSSGDMYLGLSGMDPSSNSCNEIVVRVTMPGVKFSSVDLQVTETKLYVTSPNHKLFLYLPHRVKSEKGTAKWNSSKSQLSVVLPTIQDT